MAENQGCKCTAVCTYVLNDLKKLVWGSELTAEVVRRWSQGFVFSENEHTALVQHEGGPCAVIAPVQAFLLKNAIFGSDKGWRQFQDERRQMLLISALRDILVQCSNNGFIMMISIPHTSNENEERIDASTGNLSEITDNEEDDKSEVSVFHSSLRMIHLETTDHLTTCLKEKIPMLKDPFGVILFLYSVLLTKGIDQIKNEMEDPNEPLIDGTHGHGSQSLINLLLTGHAVSNVWDNDKNVSGLKLQGITRQPTVGFLTLLEHLRYCEVGWFLKCPCFPIWVLGSETHLTVLFSEEKALCTPETPEAAAKRVFKSFDPEGNNFISTILLGDVLKTLDLVDDVEYVEMMKKKLDSEGLGIILLNTFMEEFYPNESSSLPSTFVLYHYNGLKRSCIDQKVAYQEGHATLMDFEVKLYSESSPILCCLQTKWPGLDVEWNGSNTPSLN